LQKLFNDLKPRFHDSVSPDKSVSVSHHASLHNDPAKLNVEGTWREPLVVILLPTTIYFIDNLGLELSQEDQVLNAKLDDAL
jgi:hypothetical protein